MTARLRLHQFSFGVTSAESAWRDAQAHGASAIVLAFADTLCEDEDTYRFGIEAAAVIFGRSLGEVADLAQQAAELTPLEARDLPRRKRELQALQWAAIRRFGDQLAWLQDGRTIWEVARHARWVNNSRACKATEHLKGRYLDSAALGYPGATRVFGMDWTEDHRIVRLRKRLPNEPLAFPMTEPPFVDKAEVIAAWRARDVEPPRLYGLGFPHGNCGGGCARQGQTGFARLLWWNRPRYLWHEDEELATQAHIGAPYTVLREIVRGEIRPLSLRAFRERLESSDLFAQQIASAEDDGVCGCFVELPEAA